MKLNGLPVTSYLGALAQLIRLPNVLIILLTQLLLRYCIISPFIYSSDPGAISLLPDFLILVLATMLIAIGGYVINDYFDVKIDSVNRPDKLVVNKVINARTAIKVHMILNGIAILLGFYLAYRVKAITFGLLFPFISGVLWIYSAKYKRMIFWGNFIVAGTTAFIILVVWLFEFFWLRLNASLFANEIPEINSVTYVFVGYAVFAFLISMVRELVKDMEDTEGDKSIGSKTIPLVLGINRTRYLVALIVFTGLILLGYVQMILCRLDMMMLFWYFLIAIQLPFVYFLIKLFGSREKQNYHFLSSLCELIMLTGILSMEVLFISN